MKKYLKDDRFQSDLVAEMVNNGIIGGQFADGSQKDGFLKYEKGRPVAVYSLEENRYIPLDEKDWTKNCDGLLGDFPKGHYPWKMLLMDKGKPEKLKTYFKNLFAEKTLGATLAQSHLKKSEEIGLSLVSDGIAANIDDVNTILMNGFYHLYGPQNEYF